MRTNRSRWLALVCLALCVTGTFAFAVNATVTQGTLCTSPGSAPIKDSDLATWIGGINNSAQKLLVLTECFGGNTASAFAGQANTAVISATIPGQKAQYGGYDSGASAALKPGAANTGATVHAGGVAAKSAKETPSQLGDGNGGTPNTGNLNPANFSLAPVDPVNGPIKSRHVVIYAGQPGGPNNNDVNQATTIANAFGNANPGMGTAGAAGTTVTTVGDAGMGAWNKPGTAAGLKSAIDAAKTAINGSADPSKEQFLLYVTDHGDMNQTQKRTVTFTPGVRKALTDTTDTSNNPSTNSSLQCFQTSQFTNPGETPLQVLTSATSSGGFNVTVDLSNDTDANGSAGNNMPLSLSGLSSVFSSWVLDAVIQTGPNAGTDVTLTNPIIEPFDLDGDTTIGDTPDEGVTLEFPVAPSMMVSSFFDVFTELDLTTGSSTPSSGSWNVGDPSQDTGEIPEDLPEPASLGVLGLGLAALLRRRK